MAAFPKDQIKIDQDIIDAIDEILKTTAGNPSLHGGANFLKKTRMLGSEIEVVEGEQLDNLSQVICHISGVPVRKNKLWKLFIRGRNGVEHRFLCHDVFARAFFGYWKLMTILDCNTQKEVDDILQRSLRCFQAYENDIPSVRPQRKTVAV